MNTSAKDLPLEGCLVVELGDNAAAPFCGQVLAALGAEVWKIERPMTGDASRGWGPSKWRGSSAAYHSLNRGKRSVSLDIKDPAQLEELKQMIRDHADVFLHNLRPGSAPRYGLDPASLRAGKPELVCCEVGAFGHRGPLDKHPGYDPLMQAFSGIMSLTGEDGQAPVRAGVSIVDFGTGMWAAIGVLSALLKRKTTGRGSSVNSSLLETAIAWMAVGIANYSTDGNKGGRHGSGIAFIVPHRAYTASDGHLAISCGNDRLFGVLCRALDRPQWAEDPKFATNAGRLTHRAEIDELIGQRIASNTRAYWQDRLERIGVACAPVQDVAELCAHEQTKALGIIAAPHAGEIPLVGLPLSFDHERPPPLSCAPELGQHGGEFRARFVGVAAAAGQGIRR